MMNNTLRALYYGLNTLSDISNQTIKTAFLNAQYSPEIERLSPAHTLCQQYLKHHADALKQNGYNVCSDALKPGIYDLILIALPKNQVESTGLIAQGLTALKTDGIMICAADNKAGGTRLPKTLQSLGIKDFERLSKHKARICIVRKTNEATNASTIKKAISATERHLVNTTGFIAQAGIFGWNKIDKGSEILSQILPDTLSGFGADFGCGYGYLSAHILKHCANIQSLYLIDTDIRAVECAQENLQAYQDKTHFMWRDLSNANTTDLRKLDFIVMNPPFHSGKQRDISLGQSLIQTAASTLKKGGKLYMVANVQLPYEDTLPKIFSVVKKPHEMNGFKVFVCTR